ncbi:hypothetical protein ACFLRA_03950 [Bdellovibrionota bacterium]
MQSEETKGENVETAEEFSEKRNEGAIAEVMRKVAMTGLGAIFMTEETIRQTITEMKLPKEILGKVLSNASKGKDELIKSFAKEFKALLSKFNVPDEITKYLQRHDVHVNAKISFSPKKEDQPEVE